MPQAAFAAAAFPLFDAGLVDTVEWSFDMGWVPSGVPDWVDGLLDDYAADRRSNRRDTRDGFVTGATEQALADYQAALLGILHDGTVVDDMIDQLRTAAAGLGVELG